ncbi:MAG: ABC transporter permease [Verrucomicrobiota bacterium]|jgi:ribose transport system permease protein
MSSPTIAARRASPRRLAEAGLLLVVFVLGLLLSVAGGSVERPRFETMPDGTRQRARTTNAMGEEVPATERVNKFFNAQNLAQLAKDTSFFAIMAVGMTFVIVAGQIDLSIGSIYALCSVLTAMLLRHYGPEGSAAGAGVAGTWLAVGACMAVGVGCGLANGVMVTGLGVHPFIITLGTMAIYRGIAFVATQGQSIGSFPEPLRRVVGWQAWGGLTLTPLLITVVVTAVAGVFLSRTVPGRHVYAVGGNELASRFSGIRTGRVKVLVFMASGLAASLAAMVQLGYYGAASSNDGQGYELHVIASAVVGGASLSGGRGSALGAALGALVIQMITSGIVIVGIDQNYSQIIIGLVVVAAVLLDQANQWWRRRQLVAQAR